MSDINLEVVYFEKGGPQNTDKELEIEKIRRAIWCKGDCNC